MIIFYNKKTGRIFSKIDGRVHNKKILACKVSDSTIKDNDIAKMIIGYQETNIEEEVEKVSKEKKQVLDFTVEVETKEKAKKTKNIKHNGDKFDFLDKIDNGENIFDYKINIKTKELDKV